MAELLDKIGMSKPAIEILIPFLVHMGVAHAGLLEKNVAPDVAKQVYDLAMFGFLASHPDVMAEIDAIMKDEEKRKHAIQVVLEAVLSTMKPKDEEPAPEVKPEEKASGTKATLH